MFNVAVELQCHVYVVYVIRFSSHVKFSTLFRLLRLSSLVNFCMLTTWNNTLWLSATLCLLGTHEQLQTLCMTWTLFHGELWHAYTTVYSELMACNPTLTRWLQHRYKQPFMRHGTVTTPETGLVEKQPTEPTLDLLTTPWNKKVTTRSTAYYARHTRIIHCRPCCNLLL